MAISSIVAMSILFFFLFLVLYLYRLFRDYSFCFTATLLNFYLNHLSAFLAHVYSPCSVWPFAVIIFIDLYITYVDIVVPTKHFLNPLNHLYCLSLDNCKQNDNIHLRYSLSPSKRAETSKNKSTISSIVFSPSCCCWRFPSLSNYIIPHRDMFCQVLFSV